MILFLSSPSMNRLQLTDYAERFLIERFSTDPGVSNVRILGEQISPSIIMLTVPLAAAGGLFCLLMAGSTLNIYSQIGLIILVGVAAKKGILIVEFANQLRDQGLSVREAVIEASALRLRPIIMTSIATAFGALPLVLWQGAGAESRQTIAWSSSPAPSSRPC